MATVHITIQWVLWLDKWESPTDLLCLANIWTLIFVNRFKSVWATGVCFDLSDEQASRGGEQLGPENSSMCTYITNWAYFYFIKFV